jgi:hypothetical protein
MPQERKLTVLRLLLTEIGRSVGQTPDAASDKKQWRALPFVLFNKFLGLLAPNKHNIFHHEVLLS